MRSYAIRASVGLLVSGLLACAATWAMQPRAVQLQVRPRICFHMCDWQIEARVVRHRDNRWLALTWNDGQEGNSWIPLAGERSAFLQTRLVRNVGLGDYVILATVVGVGGKIRGQDSATAIVQGMGE